MLREQHCKPVRRGSPPLDPSTCRQLLSQLDNGWLLSDDGQGLTREFPFSNFHETMAFVNAVAWIAHREDHHPDLQVSYNRCRVVYTTHAAGGLTENDFICAAHIDQLLQAV
jgi:4a-hydroxytetrahydrobiopterin dehydratase